MGIQVGVVTEDKKLLQKMLTIFNNIYKENSKNMNAISLIHLKSPELVADYVKYEFPDYLIIELNDSSSSLINILSTINDDPWLHSTGIIIIYPHENEKYKINLTNMAVLAYISNLEINYQLHKIMKIVMSHTDFKKNIVNKVIEHKKGEFILDNDPSVVTSYAHIITSSLLNQKEITPNIETSIRITLTELLMNAIEHGNCNISFEEKSSFLEKGGNINELIQQKNDLPENKDKKITFCYHYTSDSLQFTICDCGNGFDHKNRNYNPESEEDLMLLHGRGIYLSKHFSKSIVYNDVGNEVTVTFTKDNNGPQKPLGFSNLNFSHYKAGDMVFGQNAQSNSLYYIQKGLYSVEVNGKTVAELSPTDVFLGEMSFLLNNKRVAAIRAKTDGTLIEIPKNTFINILKKYPNYGLYLSKLLAIRLNKMNELKTS